MRAQLPRPGRASAGVGIPVTGTEGEGILGRKLRGSGLRSPVLTLNGAADVLDDVIAKTHAALNETQEPSSAEPAGETGRVRRTRTRVPANA